MSQNEFLDLRKVWAQNFFTREIFGLKTALKSVPDCFFLEITPFYIRQRLVKSDSNQLKTILATGISQTERVMELNSDR